MNVPAILMTALSAAAAALFIVRRVRVDDVFGAFLKALASLCFVALGLVCAASSAHTAMALLAVMAEVLCLVGDVFLSVDCADAFAGADGCARGAAPASKLWTYGGFVAFMLGHVCFTAFLLWGGAWALLPAAILIGVAGGIFIYLTPRILGLRMGRLRLLASCYSIVIFTATSLAVLLAVFRGGAGRAIFAVGYALFLLSDIVLAAIMFTEGRDTPAYNAANLVLYYAGQNLIALSLLWA